MDLDEYLWRNKLNAKEFARQCGLSQATILFVKKKRVIPRLDTAMKILQHTNGQVTFEDMLVKDEEVPKESVEKACQNNAESV